MQNQKKTKIGKATETQNGIQKGNLSELQKNEEHNLTSVLQPT